MSQTGSAARPGQVAMEVSQEVRFAVVMYGGVSLAIYMNGVAQEMLHLVRATAADPADRNRPFSAEVKGTERVYRRLGQMLGSAAGNGHKPWSEGDPIRTRFVIDIIAGTSAGGINGIYLAKALANGQAIDGLQKLWVEKGDIGVLLNDKESAPQSLLNGKYMYEQLLDAFEGMDRQSAALPASPYVDDLDLFVTTTDIRGLPVSLRLWDKVADERRHRNVFRFRYRSGQLDDARNDFGAANNKLLAFASRCTSAFPFAFEPMRAEDAVAVDAQRPHAWDEFFPMYRVPPGVSGDRARAFHWSERAFGDGGYLDNKPFSYAIDMLAARRAAVPVDRKLIYVEPDPEHIDWEEAAKESGRPHAIANVNAALSLARYETIREDLERILDRNRLIERVERILSGIEEDAKIAKRAVPGFAASTYGSDGLAKSIEMHGASYGGYHRLKVAELTDQLSEMIARVGAFDPDSDQFRAIRYLVRLWRDQTYEENGNGGRATQNRFLVEFDIGYRLRRVSFVLRKIDQLYALTPGSAALLARWDLPMPQTPQERSDFRAELQRLCRGLGGVHRDLRRARASIGREADVADAVNDTGLDVDALRNILAGAVEEDRLAAARALLDDPKRGAAFDALRQAVGSHIAKATFAAAKACEDLLDGDAARSDETPFQSHARVALRAFYTSFETYDMIAYPILYSTGVGEESDPIEVLRISPQDAPLVKGPGQRKLAGTSLGHFGAFLDRGWRENDILWGRLDGAERLITALLQTAGYADDVCRELVAEAHMAILEETFSTANRDALCQLLADAIAKGIAKDGSADVATLQSMVATQPGAAVNPLIQAALRACLDPAKLYEFFKTGYQVNMDLDRRAATDTVGRATRITGKLLENIAKTEQVTDRPAVWLARLGSGVSAILELAVPSSIVGAIGKHLLAFLVVVEAFIGVGGFLLGQQDAERLGFVSLILTLGAWAIAHLLGDFVVRRRGWRRILSLGAAAALVAFLLLAGNGVRHLWDDAEDVARSIGLRDDRDGETATTSAPSHAARRHVVSPAGRLATAERR